MPLQTVKGQCQNPVCKKKGEQQTLTLDSSKNPRCSQCAQLLTNVVKTDVKVAAVPGTPYEKAKKRVLDARGNTPLGNYVANVVKFLDVNHKFRNDFIEEMDKDVDFTKFVKNASPARATSARDICVDNALRAVGANLPVGCPEGEKYTFEVPYIMQAAGWTYLDYSQNRPMLQAPISTFRGRARQETGARVYLLVRSEQAGATESHMVVVYVTAQGPSQEAWIHDVQEQNNSYASGFCEVWMMASAAAPRRPFCSLDLQTGAIGTWQR